jgi:RND family efflux transporter MFP subunit
MTNPHGRPPLSRREKFALTVASLVILLASGAVVLYMVKNRPQPERRKPVPSAQIVSVRELAATSRQVFVPAMGTVVPAVEVDLKSRVAGEILWIHPEFVEGGIVKKDQALVKIDPTEYELALIRTKAVLQSAMLELRTEEGRQEIARSEWAILGLEENSTELDRELALRQPQLAANRAKLEAARAEIKQAELNLERTVVKAPFNAIIRSANVDAGAQVTNQGTLANLVGSDRFYIEALIPMDRIKWIHIPDNSGDAGSSAKIVSGSGRILEGRLYKLLGEIESNGRQARLLIEVKDPLDLTRKNGDRHPLLLNDYVSVEIEGRSVQDVFVIERQHVRDGNMVYIVDEDDRLQVRTVEIVWSSGGDVLVRGPREGERLIISDLPAPVEGMKVSVSEDQEPGASSTGHGDAKTR